jgi:Flp pilus assembly protein TadG
MDNPIENHGAAPPGKQAGACCRGTWFRNGNERGQALLEFAFLLPLLMAVLLGIIVFGIALNNYLELTNGATAGAQALAVSRGQTLDPCAAVSNPFYLAAPNLTKTNVQFTITTSPGPSGAGSSNTLWSGSGTPSCSSSSTTTGAPGELVQGETVTVNVTYPCNLRFFGVYFGPSTCTLTAQTAEAIQ